jgi:hypothetical protein
MYKRTKKNLFLQIKAIIRQIKRLMSDKVGVIATPVRTIILFYNR